MWRGGYLLRTTTDRRAASRPPYGMSLAEPSLLPGLREARTGGGARCGRGAGRTGAVEGTGAVVRRHVVDPVAGTGIGQCGGRPRVVRGVGRVRTNAHDVRTGRSNTGRVVGERGLDRAQVGRGRVHVGADVGVGRLGGDQGVPKARLSRTVLRPRTSTEERRKSD